jgi:lipoprotein-anchoring transpeptidase ErfK/SrfK
LLAAAVVVLTPALAAGAYAGWHGFSEAQAAADASAAIASARQQIDRDQQLGVDTEDLTPLRQSLATVETQDRQARGAAAHRAAAGSASGIQSKAANLGEQQHRENQAIGAEADRLAASADSTDALRQSGQASLAADRNDATVAIWAGGHGIERLARNAERYGTYLSANDRKQVALGVAGVGYLGGEIHQAMVAALPPKAITISIKDQQLVAYENRKPVLQTPVTTGHIPDLATDIGPMKVLKKDSPWKMHSPWPKGSPNWYPDTVVQMVVWFTATGEGMHDASWQTLPYGPGSETGPDASHGCVHVPLDAEKFLYSWTEAGQPVIVFPGDGSPLQAQLDQRSVDQNGYPLSGPRGA